MNGIEVAFAASPGYALAAWLSWLHYKLIRDGKLKTASTPRKQPLAIEPPREAAK